MSSKLNLGSRDYAKSVKKPRFSYGVRTFPSGCVGQNLAKKTHWQLKESWESNSEEIKSLLADAKELVSHLNLKCMEERLKCMEERDEAEPVEEGEYFGIGSDVEDDMEKHDEAELVEEGEYFRIGSDEEDDMEKRDEAEPVEEGEYFEIGSDEEDDMEERNEAEPVEEGEYFGIGSDEEDDMEERDEAELVEEGEYFGIGSDEEDGEEEPVEEGKCFENGNEEKVNEAEPFKEGKCFRVGSDEVDDDEELVEEGKCFGIGIEEEYGDDDEEPVEGQCFEIETEEEDHEEEVRVLSPAKWSMLPLRHKENSSSHKANRNKIVDFVDLCSVGTKFDQQSGMLLDSKLVETANREEFQEQSYDNELINLQIGKHEQPHHAHVMETLKLFREKYVQLKKCSLEIRDGKISKPAHTEARELVKKMGMRIFVDKPFGHIPGIEIGDTFQFRTELTVVGLHGHFVSGIHYVKVVGKICATSVVESGQYENTAKTDNVLIYSGQGGNPKLAGSASDQKLERGNLSLVNSMEMGYPIRVIFKRRNVKSCRTLGTNQVYVYDGLYTVNDYWQEIGEHGKLVFMFELRRLSDQPRPCENILSKPIKRMNVCVLNDVSQGKEKFPVRVVNGVDDDRPPQFTYITKIALPHWFNLVKAIGCNCTNICSNLKQCPCALKKNRVILGAKPRVNECGPSCKCHPSCINRVSQHGPCYQLEVFRTESRGWGVRSKHYISKGSFICEYIGELVRVMEVQQRIFKDKHLRYIWKGCYEKGQGLENGFAFDSTMCGNIGRFINHSSTSNLIAKEVFIDHDDKRVPHIMFFASKNIGPFQELTYDYT